MKIWTLEIAVAEAMSVLPRVAAPTPIGYQGTAASDAGFARRNRGGLRSSEPDSLRGPLTV